MWAIVTLLIAIAVVAVVVLGIINRELGNVPDE